MRIFHILSNSMVV